MRDFIRERFLAGAIISLPGDTFRNRGQRVKTSVLVLEKKQNDDEKQPSCFAFFSEALGVDNITPRASDADIQAARDRGGRPRPIKYLKVYAEYLADGKRPSVLNPSRLNDRLDLKYCVIRQPGRMAGKWRTDGIEVSRLDECLRPVEDIVIPREHSETEFTLIKVSYDGICEIEKIKKGKAIKAGKMFKVRAGQMVFSQIRATDGAIGIVPREMDGALVSGSYYVFECGNEEETAYCMGRATLA